jgi:hypothetical protein
VLWCLGVDVGDVGNPHHASKHANKVISRRLIIRVRAMYLWTLWRAIKAKLVRRCVIRENHSLKIESVENVCDRVLGSRWVSWANVMSMLINNAQAIP